MQCSVDDDCARRGAAFAGATCVESVCQADATWSCIGRAPVVSTQPGPFQVRFHLTDLITQRPKADVRSSLCHKVDVDCAVPAGMALGDSSGQVTLQVPAAFIGYALFQADGYLDTLYFFNPIVDHDQEIPTVNVASPAAGAAIVQQLGRSQLADRGNATILAQDCTGTPAPGVSFSTPNGDDLSIPFYVVGGLPTATASATDETGNGGMINLPAGAVTVKGALAASGLTVGEISLLTRAGAVSYSQIVPLGN